MVRRNADVIFLLIRDNFDMDSKTKPKNKQTTHLWHRNTDSAYAPNITKSGVNTPTI